MITLTEHKDQPTPRYDDYTIKRCYLPYNLEWKCPSCNTDIRQDLGEEYLSYPEIGRGSINDVEIYCVECDVSHTVYLSVRFQVDLLALSDDEIIAKFGCLPTPPGGSE